MDEFGRQGEAFRQRWAADLGKVEAPEEAALLPATARAAQRAWQRFSAGAAILIAEASARARDAVRSIESAVRETAPIVGQVLLAVAQVAAVTYAEHLNEQYRRADLALRARGWWVLASWDDDDIRHYAELASTLDRHALDRELCRQYRANNGRAIRRLMRGWWDQGPYRLRRPILRDALADHLDGRYRVSIPTLLPSVEGIVADAFGLGMRTRVTAGLEPLAEILDGLDALELDVAIESLSSLYGWADFTATSSLSPRLNRHLILHGRTVRYGSEANSLKVVLHLDQLHSQLSTKTRLERGLGAPLEQRPIRTANELVKNLGVPDEMIAAARELRPLLEARAASGAAMPED